MKKYLLQAFMIACTFTLRAQIPNPGFENLNTDGTVKSWGDFFLIPITFDSSGVSTFDSIVFDNQLYFSTTDAHTGQRALEMRNAYNYTAGQAISGSARLMINDSSYSFASIVPLAQSPQTFYFYYKFLPAGPDTAIGTMIVYDANANEIGESSIEISTPASAYALAAKPITYTVATPAAFASVSFRTAKPGSPATFGTRFLVDDVNSLITGLAKNGTDAAAWRCFPNPVQDQLQVQLAAELKGRPLRICISSPDGRILQSLSTSGYEQALSLDVTQLEKGAYLLSLSADQIQLTHVFIK